MFLYPTGGESLSEEERVPSCSAAPNPKARLALSQLPSALRSHCPQQFATCGSKPRPPRSKPVPLSIQRAKPEQGHDLDSRRLALLLRKFFSSISTAWACFASPRLAAHAYCTHAPSGTEHRVYNGHRRATAAVSPQSHVYRYARRASFSKRRTLAV